MLIWCLRLLRTYRGCLLAKVSYFDILLRFLSSDLLGGGYFKKEVEQRLNRRSEPLKKGGDRKSSAYRSKFEINRV